MSKMNKIWIVINNASYRKKQKIYTNESSLLKAINPNLNQEIFEYNLVSSSTGEDYLKGRNRDTQLRSVLGELDVKEESAIKLISYYSDVAPDGRVYRKNWRTNETITFKQKMIIEMEKFQTDKKAFASLIVKNKRYFMTICSDVEWYRLLLSCHNFRSHYYNSFTAGDDEKMLEHINNFKEAKKMLRKN